MLLHPPQRLALILDAVVSSAAAPIAFASQRLAAEETKHTSPVVDRDVDCFVHGSDSRTIRCAPILPIPARAPLHPTRVNEDDDWVCWSDAPGRRVNIEREAVL